jgi:O-antigen/teichoic acid export membrane protein
LRKWLELLLMGMPSLLALAAGPILARSLGPEGRGEFALALYAFAAATTLGNFGQAERLAADLREQSTSREGPRYFVCGSASSIAAVCAYIALRTIKVDPYTSLAVALAVPLSSLGLMWRALAISRGRTLLVAAQSAAPAVLRLAFLAVLFILGHLTVFTAIALTMWASSIGALTLFWALNRSPTAGSLIVIPKGSRRSQFRADLKTGLVEGLPVVGFSLNSLVIFRADVFMLSAMSTREQVGYYAAAVAVSEASWAVSAAFKNRMQAAAYTSQPLKKIRSELTVMLVLALPFVVVGELVTRQFTVAIFGENFSGAVPAMRILLITAIALMILDCGQGLLVVFGQRRAMFSTTAVGAGITVVALWLLIPRFGAAGAALASLGAYSIVGVASWILALKAVPRWRVPVTESTPI